MKIFTIKFILFILGAFCINHLVFNPCARADSNQLSGDVAPRIAVGQFASRDYLNDYNALAAGLSDLLISELSQNSAIKLVERSRIREILDETGMSLATPSAANNAIQVGKMTDADIVVTGYLLSVKGEQIAVVKAIDPNQGLVLSVEAFLVDPVNLVQSVDMIAKFILASLDADRQSKSRKIISVGAFKNSSEKSDDVNQGDIIRNTLEMRYAKTPGIKMMARSLLIPLINDQRLKDAGFASASKARDPQQHEFVLIDGSYITLGDGVAVRLNISLIGVSTRVYSLKARSWDEIHEMIGQRIDTYLCLNRQQTDPADAAQSDIFYESGKKISALTFTQSPFAGKYVGTYNFGDDYVHGQYQDSTPDKKRKANITRAMENFQKALQLNANHYKAMLLLACCLKRIEQYGPRIRVAPRDFAEITYDVQRLYNKLIENGYINQNGEVLEKFQKMSSYQSLSGLPEKTADVLSAEQIGLARARELLETVIMASDDPDLKQRAVNELCRPFGFSHEKEQLEAEHHFKRGKIFSGLKYKRSNRGEVGFPPVITGGFAHQGAESVRHKNLQDAINEFEAAIYLNPKYYEAMLFLAICLEMEGRHGRAKEIYEQVIAEAPYDAMRFIAAKKTGKPDQIKYTRAFCQQTRIEKKIRAFYTNRLKSALGAGQGTNEAKELQAIFKKAVLADCQDSCQSTAFELLQKLGGETHLTDSLKKELFGVLNDKYPHCVAYITASVKITDRGISSRLVKILASIENGFARPHNQKLFYRQLGRRLKECIAEDHWQDAILIGSHMKTVRELGFLEHAMLAYAYYQSGQHQQAVNCLHQLVYADISAQQDAIRVVHRLTPEKSPILLKADDGGFDWFKKMADLRNDNQDVWFKISSAISEGEVLVDMATRDEILWFCTNPRPRDTGKEKSCSSPGVYRLENKRIVKPVKLPFPITGEITAMEACNDYLLINTDDGCLKLSTNKPDFLFFADASKLPENINPPQRCDIDQQFGLFLNPLVEPKFIDENDYYASGFLDDRVYGIYRHKGADDNGYPYYENQSSGCRIKFVTKGSFWAIVNDNNGLLYRSMRAKDNQLPDFSPQWGAGRRLTPGKCQPDPCPGLVEKLSSAGAAVPLSDLNSSRADCPAEGICKDYYPEGSLKSKKQYEYGQLHGQALTYYPDGRIYEKAAYQRGKLSGPRQIYFKNGMPYFVGNYKNGAPHGDQFCFANDETVSAAYMYSDGKFKKRLTDLVGLPRNGTHIVYYDRDKDWQKQKMDFRDLRRSGPAVFYYSSGKVFEKSVYKNDKLHGHLEKYYPQGGLIAETEFVDGLQDGFYRSYHRNGKIFLEVAYRAGKISGTHKKYYTDGSLFREHNYGLDQNKSIIREYYKNGSLLFESIAQSNSGKGMLRFYTPEGSLCYQAEYDRQSVIPPESKGVAELQWYEKHWGLRNQGGWKAMIRHKTKIKEFYYQDLEIYHDTGVYTQETAPYYPDSEKICICSFDKRAVSDAENHRIGCILNHDGWNGKWQFGK